jgi:hypothetical protein
VAATFLPDLGELIERDRGDAGSCRHRCRPESAIPDRRTDALCQVARLPLVFYVPANLTELSQALQKRLEAWAHPNVRLGMEWMSDPAKSVVLQQPVAGIKTGEGAQAVSVCH